MLKRRVVLGGLAATLASIFTRTLSMAQESSSVNAEALATLRPGMSVADVAGIIGSSWSPPASHKGGVFDVLQNSHGFVVRFDRNDRIGSVTFDWRFEDTAVEGLKMGMSLRDTRITMPDLDIGPDQPMMRGVRYGLRRSTNGTELMVTFTLEKVNGIRFHNRDASYRERTMPPYPDPSGQAGAPFTDTNFKLVVLSSLLDAKAVDLGTPENLATHVLVRPVDLEDEGYEPIPELVDYLARYPLTDLLLAQVRSIVFDGGNEIYRFAWYFWGGDTDMFDISSISGIELCPNVTSLNAISMIERLDLRQLVPLGQLEDLSIATPFHNLDALTDLSALKKLRIVDDETYADAITPGHTTRSILDRLKARGVAVLITPKSSSNGKRPPPFA